MRLRSTPNRRGATVLIVIAAITVCLVLVTTWLKSAINEHRRMQSITQKAQATWLAESAIERGAARLAVNSSYVGETWRVAADELGGRFGAEVTIRAEASQRGEGQRTITAQVDYPADLPNRIRQLKQITIDLSRSGDSP